MHHPIDLNLFRNRFTCALMALDDPNDDDLGGIVQFISNVLGDLQLQLEMMRRLSGVDQKLQEKWARERAALPNTPLAQKLYGSLNKPLLNDAKRQHVSPLGGVAQPTKPQRRGRR
jgi:hypothetical protein